MSSLYETLSIFTLQKVDALLERHARFSLECWITVAKLSPHDLQLLSMLEELLRACGDHHTGALGAPTPGVRIPGVL